MKNVIIKQTILGRGMPKICAPLVEKDYESLIHQAASFTEQPVDIAEWRADWFNSILEPDTLDRSLAEHAICSGHVHLVDLELFSGDDMIRETIDLAHRHQVSVILSNHDFAATPKEEEILRRLHHMEDLGADIAKIAVMPQSAGDVLTLLSATHKASQSLSCPLITMSMGQQGMVSRICGAAFGSCAGFATAGVSSAPGQPAAPALRTALDALGAMLG